LEAAVSCHSIQVSLYIDVFAFNIGKAQDLAVFQLYTAIEYSMILYAEVDPTLWNRFIHSYQKFI